MSAVANRVAYAVRVPVVIGVLVLAGAFLRAGDVVATQAIVTGVLTGGVYGLVAMGLTLIFGVLDIVNFAHGAFLALALFVTYGVVQATGVHPYLALLVAVPGLFCLGWLTQFTVLNRAMGRPLENQLLVTLGFSLLIENGLLLFLGANPRSVAFPGDRGLDVFGAVAPLSRVLAFAAALVLGGGLYLLLRHSRAGTAIRAVAANREGAALVGVDVRHVHALTFALGTACAGAAGTLVAPFTTIEPTSGSLFTIIAFVVVVLGGMGDVLGALAGGVLIGLAEQLGGVYLPGQSPLLTVFAVFLLVLFLKPRGLFGRAG
jgi:branched-chain amino acid transport system permease protein